LEIGSAALTAATAQQAAIKVHITLYINPPCPVKTGEHRVCEAGAAIAAFG
jgi:hypothetical protein